MFNSCLLNEVVEDPLDGSLVELQIDGADGMT
jgi:hypothetical protein